MLRRPVDAVLCNGSTADSDSVCLGSNPSTAASKETSALPGFLSYYEVWLSLVERYVRDVEAGGSNPLTSTKMKPGAIDAPDFLFLKKMSANLWISFFIFDCWSINCSKALRFSSGIVFCCMMRIEKQTGP